MRPLFFCLLIFISSSANAQTVFEKIYGVKGDDDGECVIQTADKGYLIGGFQATSVVDDQEQHTILVIKTDSLGKTQWQYSSGSGSDDYLWGLTALKTGGYVIAASNYASEIGETGILIKLSNTGKVVWRNEYGVASVLKSVVEDVEGNLIAVGHTPNTGDAFADVYLLKTDSTGSEIWSKTYGGKEVDHGNSLQITSDGGFVITGMTYTEEARLYSQVYILRTDKTGEPLWEKTLGAFGMDEGNCVKQTADGGFIIAGEVEGNGQANRAAYIVKTSSAGAIEWERVDSILPGQLVAGFNGVTIAADGGLVACGYFAYKEPTGNPNKVIRKCYVVKYSADGKREWMRMYGAAGDNTAYSICTTKDHGFALVGNKGGVPDKKSEIWFLKLNADGTLIKKPVPRR